MPTLGVIPFQYPNNFISPETRGIVLPEAENRTIVSSFVWTECRNVAECQTDGQTTDRNGLASTAGRMASHADAL